jgi:hypothetical protein
MPRETYAAIWAPDDVNPVVGSLTVGSSALTFDGRGLHEDVAYGEIDSISLDRTLAGRVGGRTSLVLALAGRTIRLALPEPGALHELTERLTSATA